MRSELREYLTTRLVTGRVAALWLLVSGAAALADGAVRLPGWLCEPALIALAIAAFRLWDDLADRGFDAVHHRDRVLVRTANGRGFALLAALGVSLFLLLVDAVKTRMHALVAAGLAVATALTYLFVPGDHPLRPLRSAVVLLKYPVWILLLADDPTSPRASWTAGATYLALGLHEAATATRLRPRGARRYDEDR